MLRLPAFQFHAPETAAEAARILAEDPANTRVVAGGTDLWPNMKRRHQGAKTIVSLRSIPEMTGICVDDEGGVIIGATTQFPPSGAFSRGCLNPHPGEDLIVTLGQVMHTVIVKELGQRNDALPLGGVQGDLGSESTVGIAIGF